MQHHTIWVIPIAAMLIIAVPQPSRRHLAKKFRDSKLNALFIVPSAPRKLDEPVRWPCLSSVSLGLAKHKRPKGPIVVAGHSAAYLTIIPWLGYSKLNHIILINAFYKCEADFERWLYRSKHRARNRLVLAAHDTAKWGDPWVKRLSGTHTLAWIPTRYRDFSTLALDAKVLYMRSQYGHWELVKRHDVVPLLLRLSPLKRL